MLKGPSPGEPSPPRMQVPTHLMVQDSAFLDLGRWILGLVQSLDESCWGMLDSVSASCGASMAMAEAEAITAAANSPAVVVAILLLFGRHWQLVFFLLVLVHARLQKPGFWISIVFLNI